MNIIIIEFFASLQTNLAFYQNDHIYKIKTILQKKHSILIYTYKISSHLQLIQIGHFHIISYSLYCCTRSGTLPDPFSSKWWKTVVCQMSVVQFMTDRLTHFLKWRRRKTYFFMKRMLICHMQQSDCPALQICVYFCCVFVRTHADS